MRRFARQLYWIVPLAAWSGLVLLSLLLVLRQTDEDARETARQQGRDIFRMVEATRLWNARTGASTSGKANRCRPIATSRCPSAIPSPAAAPV